MENIFKKFKPIYNFFIPYGWAVDKNNLFNIDVKEIFLERNKSIKFEIKDKFFVKMFF